MINNITPFKKYQISLREINTGESKDVTVQVNQSIDVVRYMISNIFDDTIYELTDIVEIKSILQIAVEPYCTN